MSVLDEIGLRHNTDKSSRVHDFLRLYEDVLSPRRDQITDFLEIGVYDGGSLRTWSEYLPHCRITGIDIDPRCLSFAKGNVVVELSDQSSHLALQRLQTKLLGRHPDGFDVILDDGSHVWSHQILTFETLFSSLKPKGVFIVEDADTSYGDHIPRYKVDSTITAAEYFFRLCNYVLAGGQMKLAEELDLRLRCIIPEVDSIQIIRRSMLIHRK